MNDFDQEKRTDWTPFLWVSILVILLWALAFKLPFEYFDSWADRAHFGEMFGSVNALFSGLALIALIYTLHLQRLDLRQSQEQSQKQAEQLEGQQQLLSQQAFEDTFFRMLDLLRMQTNEIRIAGGKISDEDTFKFLYDQFKRFYNKDLAHFFPNGESEWIDPEEETKIIRSAFEMVKVTLPELLNYLGTFFSIILFLEMNDTKRKEFYGMLLSSQLGQLEKLLLFYYFSLPEYESTRKGIERYHVLHAIKLSELRQPFHRDKYEKTAWEGLSIES